MIPAADALALIAENVPERIGRLALENCQGLVLAEDIIADRDYPPFDRAAMDGFAVRFHELQEGLEFRADPALFAGQLRQTAGARVAVRIMTGAAVPETFDAVVRIEDATSANERVTLKPARAVQWLNIARRAEDASARDVVVPVGTRVNAAVMASAAACGFAELSVFAPPRIHIITTGNEIKDVDSTPGPVEIRNSNRYTLSALCRRYGIHAQIFHCPDDPAVLKHRVKESLASADILLLSGGVSAGDADYVPGVLGECGVREIFHKANIRPGKPVYFGRSSALVFGLPGNPVSCHVTARVFVEPALCAFMRLPEQKEMIRLAHAVNKQHSMQEYLRVRKDAQGLAVKTQHNGSGDIFASTRADGLAVLAAEARDLPEGSEVEYLAFGW